MSEKRYTTCPCGNGFILFGNQTECHRCVGRRLLSRAEVITFNVRVPEEPTPDLVDVELSQEHFECLEAVTL